MSLESPFTGHVAPVQNNAIWSRFARSLREFDGPVAPRSPNLLLATVLPHDLHPIPMLVTRSQMAAMSHAATAVARLAPKALLSLGTPEAVASVFRIEAPEATRAFEGATTEPLARCDFIDSPDGFKCVEMNTSGALGGWASELLVSHVTSSSPPVAAFVERERIDILASRDTLKEFLRHVARGAPPLSKCNVFVLLPARPEATGRAELVRAFLDAVYSGIRAELGRPLDGEVLFGTSGDLGIRDGHLHVSGVPVHVVLERTAPANAAVGESVLPVHVDEALVTAIRERTARVFNGPARRLLGDKRTLALISSAAESPVFTDAESQAVARHVPFTRIVDLQAVTRFRGADVSMRELLSRDRENLVLKPAADFGGSGVTVGRSTTSSDWESAILAARAGDWVVQEFVSAERYWMGSRADVPHSAVWGLFTCGSSYLGGIVRAAAEAARPGVVNAALGATVAAILEVNDDATD